MGGTERNRCLFPTLRTVGARFRFGERMPWRGHSRRGHPLALAVLAAFGFVLELLIVEEQLLSRGEDEVSTTIDTFQYLVLEFHCKRRSHTPNLLNTRDPNGKDPVHNVGRRLPTCISQWTRPTRRCTPHGLLTIDYRLQPVRLSVDFVLWNRAALPQGSPLVSRLILLFPCFLAAALARQSFLHPLLFTRLQVERVTFYFFDYVLGLYLPFEAAKSILEGFSLLKPNFRQSDYTPLLVLTGPLSYGKPCKVSQVECAENFFFLTEVGILAGMVRDHWMGEKTSTPLSTNGCSESGTHGQSPRCVRYLAICARNSCASKVAIAAGQRRCSI